MCAIERPVMIDWQLSSYFGWGVYGIHLMLNWIQQQKQPLLTYIPVNQQEANLNPVEWAAIQPGLEPSWDWQTRMAAFRGRVVSLSIPVLHALFNDFVACSPGSDGIGIAGTPDLGVIFFESPRFSAEGRERARKYSLLVTGSSWNRSVLEEAGIGPSALVLQGVDPTRFHPAPQAGWFAGRFAIFSGGKLEYRKGQDLVLKAFRIFADRHPDALLVAAWASPFPRAARSFDADWSLKPSTIKPVPLRPDGEVDAAAWAVANGIRPEQFLDLGSIPNGEMPRILRETDAGLFPNRAEGGTNLVAMECMACGVPVILSANTGHLDLIAPDRCYPLTRQTPIEGAARQGWGESDIEEILEALERIRDDREESRARATQGADFMSTMTWAATARQMAETIAPYV